MIERLIADRIQIDRSLRKVRAGDVFRAVAGADRGPWLRALSAPHIKPNPRGGRPRVPIWHVEAEPYIGPLPSV